jgi:hypothetical protein
MSVFEMFVFVLIGVAIAVAVWWAFVRLRSRS